jgi:hypothetical protein
VLTGGGSVDRHAAARDWARSMDHSQPAPWTKSTGPRWTDGWHGRRVRGSVVGCGGGAMAAGVELTGTESRSMMKRGAGIYVKRAR